MKAIGIDIGTTTNSTVVVQTDSMEVIQSKTIPNGRCVNALYTWQDGRGNLVEFEGKACADGQRFFLYDQRLSGHRTDRAETAAIA